MTNRMKNHVFGAITVKLDGVLPYSFESAPLVPSSPGVYLVFDLRGVLYVGRTKDLARRFRNHYWIQGNPLLAEAVSHPVGPLRFGWMVLDEVAQRHKEKELVRYFAPYCNRHTFQAAQADFTAGRHVPTRN